MDKTPLSKLDDVLTRAQDERWRELALLGPDTGRYFADSLVNKWPAGHVILLDQPLRDVTKFTSLTALTHLYLNKNQLTALPPEIASLTALTHLNLANNQLTALPPQIASLTALTDLYLANNLLTALPPEIASLSALTDLYLAKNQLSALPPEIASLTALTTLDIANNQLTALPPEIASLTALMFLHLSNNQLTALPPEITSLTALTYFNLNNNQLTTLPPEITSLTALESLGIKGNPLPQSHFDALDDGLSNLFALLRSIAGETTPLYEAKLVVTGEGQVGKSWALAALRGEDPRKVVGTENTTWGIDCGDLTVAHPEHKDIEIHLNTWDFGGQAVYRITHQFFFSPQAIFLLVWNPRKGAAQCRVREWLRTIALRTGSGIPRGSPVGTSPRPRARVIMVATHAKEKGGAYQPEYGHDSLDPDLQAMIVDAIEIDSEKAYNTEALLDMVAHHAAALPDMGSPFNSRWAAARDAALRLKDDNPWITFGRFAELCADHGVTATGDQRTLAGTFMNRLGRAVWYGASADQTDGPSDALLNDTLVLDAVWLSRAFVQILEDAPTKEAGGMLDHRRFPSIWTDHDRSEWYKYSPDEYERIARMMRRFNVALPTRASDGQRSLVPQLVPALRPTLPWIAPESATGERLVRLSCQLDHEAEGLMARFIAATEPYHIYEDGKGLFWQEGVFLRDSSFDNEALVVVDGREKPLVSIVVSGKQPGFLMNELYRTLEDVIGFWKGMTRTYHIICRKKVASGGYCSGRFKFDTVHRRSTTSSRRELDCQDCDTEWTPEQLLYGLEAVRDRRQEADYQTAYLYHRETIPCPRTFLLRPANPKWRNVTSWASFVGKQFELTLVSELSGREVASKVFKIKKEWTKWLGPLTRIAAVILTGLAVPLDGDLAQQLSEGTAALDKLGSLSVDESGAAAMGDIQETRRVATEAEMQKLHKLLQHVDLDPRENGMTLAETRDGRWLWMTVSEAETHVRPEARIG